MGRKWFQTRGIALVMGMTEFFFSILKGCHLGLRKKRFADFSPNYWKCAKELAKH
jgi:hypothetical protein